MVSFNFKGLMAPTFTPVNDDLSINIEIIPAYAKFLKENGIQGVLVHGTTGEGTSLSVTERKIITEQWSKAVKLTGQHLMVNVGGAPFPEVVELAKHAEKLKVDSLMCLPELFNKPQTTNQLIFYLQHVAAAAPNTPLLYYHIPVFTNVNIQIDKFLIEAPEKIPTFRGIKFATYNLDDGISALRASSGKSAVFLGADRLMPAAYTAGFDSAIATSINIFPKLTIDILEGAKQGDFKKMITAQNMLTELCSTVTKCGSFVASMKTAMSLMTPIKVGKARIPLENNTVAEEEEIKENLKILAQKFKLQIAW